MKQRGPGMQLHVVPRFNCKWACTPEHGTTLLQDTYSQPVSIFCKLEVLVARHIVGFLMGRWGCTCALICYYHELIVYGSNISVYVSYIYDTLGCFIKVGCSCIADISLYLISYMTMMTLLRIMAFLIVVTEI